MPSVYTPGWKIEAGTKIRINLVAVAVLLPSGDAPLLRSSILNSKHYGTPRPDSNSVGPAFRSSSVRYLLPSKPHSAMCSRSASWYGFRRRNTGRSTSDGNGWLGRSFLPVSSLMGQWLRSSTRGSQGCCAGQMSGQVDTTQYPPQTYQPARVDQAQQGLPPYVV